MEQCTILSAYYIIITSLICSYSITAITVTENAGAYVGINGRSTPFPMPRVVLPAEPTSRMIVVLKSSSPHTQPLTPKPYKLTASATITGSSSEKSSSPLPSTHTPPPPVIIPPTVNTTVTISPSPPSPLPPVDATVTIYSPSPPPPSPENVPSVLITSRSPPSPPPPPPPQLYMIITPPTPDGTPSVLITSLSPPSPPPPPPPSPPPPPTPPPSPPLPGAPPALHTLPPSDSHPKKMSKVRAAVTATLVAGLVILVSIITAILCFVRIKISRKLTFFTNEETTTNQNVEDLIRHRGKNAPTRYTYADLKKMTSNLKHKLGEGGYAIVYKGELKNGFPVAIKLLKKSEDGKEFINEVAGIIGTNHVNIVTLTGFCFEGRTKAMVYEYMPNGSLDKYMYGGEKALEWGVLLQIAIGVARGLEYLHRGCNTRILHFDIKPQNILLDENFCPKIADFGLARPFLQKESIMTMSGARGTPGYIAPEVFCRGVGRASQKSDVYSYGMLVLDMVGCRKTNIGQNKQTTSSSEPYFPHWIYKQFELGKEIELQGISTDEEKQVQRKMVIVAMWCIQTGPSSRPRMSKVIEMLEANLDSLQVPPIPSLFSPPRSPDQDSPSTHSMPL